MGNQISSDEFLKEYVNILVNCVIRIKYDTGQPIDDVEEEKHKLQNNFYKLFDYGTKGFTYRDYYIKRFNEKKSQLLKVLLKELEDQFFKQEGILLDQYYLTFQENGNVLLYPPDKIIKQYQNNGENWKKIYTMGKIRPIFSEKIFNNKGGKKTKRRIRKKSYKKSYVKRIKRFTCKKN